MDYKVLWRQKDKSWQCIISYKESGKWKQKSKQGFKTQKEGKGWIDSTLKALELEVRANKSNSKPVGLVILKDFKPVFLEHQKLYKEYNTIKGYKNTFSKFANLIGKNIKDIKRIDIQSGIDTMVKEGLANSTIKSYILRLRVIFNFYKENYDYSFKIDLTNFNVPKSKKIKDKKALTKSELDKLLLNLKEHKFYIVAYIAATTGLRCGEILGLTWDNINEKELTLEVNKQWKVSNEKVSEFGDLKTKNSNRKVPVTSKILKELKEYKKQNPIPLDNRICPFNKCSIDQYLNPELQRLAEISIHELRHTYATLLIANGTDFKTVANILGHTVEMTMRTYSHVTSDMMNVAAKKINEIF